MTRVSNDRARVGRIKSILYDLLTEHKQGMSDIVSKAVDIHLGGIVSSRRQLGLMVIIIDDW